MAAEKSDKSEIEEPRKQQYRGIKAMPYIIGNETFEKLGTIGTSANLMVYLTTVFNLKRVSAASLINVWNGTSNLAPLVGAFLSDAYLGRYKTLGYACLASLTGLILMVLTSGVPDLHPPNCDGKVCMGPTPWQTAFLLLALGILVVGAGGIRSCNLAFGADQFDQTTDSGRRGINSFFNWYFFTYTFAMMIALTLIVWVQSNVSWTLGLGIPALLMMLSCVFFFVGTGIYVKVKPEGSPFSSIAQVLVAAFKKRGLKLKAQGSEEGKLWCLFDPPHTSSLVSKLSHTDQFRFLDKAAIIIGEEDEIHLDGSPANPWRLCRVQQVEEVKCILRVIPIWAAGIIFYVGLIQQSTYVVVQALQSDRRLGKNFSVPAASFSVFTMLSLTLWIPVYDRLVVPAIRKLTRKEGGITLLQRMGIGLFLSLLTMLVSAQVEQRRRGTALHHPTLGIAKGGGAISAMSSFWLIPQLTLAGLSEAFASVAQIEFYYKQFPENMRSVAGSLFFLGLSASNYLSGFLVSIIHRATRDGRSGGWLSEDLNKGRLELFYYTIAGLGILNLVYFLLCSSWYRYKLASSTAIDEVAMEPTKSKPPPV